MKNDSVRVAVVGAGTVAQGSQLPAFTTCPGAKVVAVCDANASRAEAIARSFNIPAWYGSLDEMLADDAFDAAVVCTGNSTHADIVVQLAGAKKHILCEKPMATSLPEAQRMAQAVRENGVVFMMGFVNRFRQAGIVIQDIVQAGRLGTVYHARCGLIRRRGTPVGWFTDVKRSGGGPVIDIGVHAIDLTWYLMGRPKPVSVSSVVHRRIGGYQTKGITSWTAGEQGAGVVDTEDSASALIRFENDVSMTVDVSWAINGQEEDLFCKLYGTKGGASFSPLCFYWEEDGYLADVTPQLSAEPEWQPAFARQAAHFIQCVQTGQAPAPCLEDGLTVQRMLAGIYESGQTRAEVSLA